jgi:hypothetical protein
MQIILDLPDNLALSETDLRIAQVLKDKGVPASDIMLGFHSPFKRQFSGYAVA